MHSSGLNAALINQSQCGSCLLCLEITLLAVCVTTAQASLKWSCYICSEGFVDLDVMNFVSPSTPLADIQLLSAVKVSLYQADLWLKSLMCLVPLTSSAQMRLQSINVFPVGFEIRSVGAHSTGSVLFCHLWEVSEAGKHSMNVVMCCCFFPPTLTVLAAA